MARTSRCREETERRNAKDLQESGWEFQIGGVYVRGI